MAETSDTMRPRVLAVFGNHQEMQSFVGKSLPAGDTAPISAPILIGFAGRAKEKEWAANPLFSFAETLLAQNLENRP
jgi:hypothetical protein